MTRRHEQVQFPHFKEIYYTSMSNYSTGELAKLCNVTTRTIQYYDRKGILKPQGFIYIA
jgi:hypothetical protein